MAPLFSAARDRLARAVHDRAFPAAVLEVGTATRPLVSEAFGRLTFAAEAADATPDTIFDLASLTKVLSTATLAMQAIERGSLALDDLVASIVPAWGGADRQEVTVRDLLAHCSGLAAHQPLFDTLAGAARFETAISASPLAYPPRTQSVYSDLGFMLLGFVLAREHPLPLLFETLRSQMGVAEDLQFLPPATWLHRTAPTRLDPWRGRLLLGEVDDNNAAALGGAAGHAGLFGTAPAVGACARHLLQILDGRQGCVTRRTLETFITRRTDVPHSSRALGWDTMLPTSSCGTRMSPRAFGHTGFTGTSLWIDPERGLYVVLLTNRVHPTPDNAAITAIRPAIHDDVVAAFDAG